MALTISVIVALALACFAGTVLVITTSTGSVILDQKTLKPPRALVKTYPSALKDLANSAAAEIDSLHFPRKAHRSNVLPRRATTLTSDPDVAAYMFSNENGNWDGNFGPDNGYIPYEPEPCTDGVCYDNYGKARRPRIAGFVPRKLAGNLHKPTLLYQAPRAARAKGAMRGLWQDLLPAVSKSRVQQLAWDVTDFPDIGDDAEIKDAQQRIRDLYDPLEPLEEQGERSSAEKQDYADFYRAYAAYQLPHEVSNRGGPGPWVGENDRIGGNELPPNAYPYSEAYYPPGTPKASLTINANGAGSSNVFHVQGPGQINVNIGARGEGEGEAAGGYIYPDGKTAVPVAESPTVARQDTGRAILTGGTEGAEEGPGPEQTPCDEDPQCSFWQDAYNDAYW